MKSSLLLIPFVLLLAACHEAPPSESAGSGTPVPVHVVAVTAAPWPASYEAIGTVRAKTSAVISSKVMGYVREVRVQVGDRVRAGELLVALDSQDFDAAFQRAEAMREEATHAMPEVESAIAAAKAHLDLANVTHRRMQDLFSKKSISNQEMDEATAKLKAAQANYEMAQSKRAQLKSKIAQAEQAQRSAGIMRGYAQITAPFSGVVTDKSVDPGILATPGAPLLSIEKQGDFRLEVPVDESHLPSIRIGQGVSVTLDALDKTVKARVSEIVPSVDAASRAYVVKIELPALPQLRSGIFGKAHFLLGTRQVISVPDGAVIQRGQLQSVMAVEEGTARNRLITLGEKWNGQTEVLSGLTSGEKVVFPLPSGLTDGAKVEVRQ